jgi:hypothetical protein
MIFECCWAVSEIRLMDDTIEQVRDMNVITSAAGLEDA